MAFAKSRFFKRELREYANDANKSFKIRDIRVQNAPQIGRLVNGLCKDHRDGLEIRFWYLVTHCKRAKGFGKMTIFQSLSFGVFFNLCHCY